MAARLEFFFDYVSPYSYLANERLRTFTDARIQYRPMFLGGVMKAADNRPPGTVAAKRRYLEVDLDRWARRYGIPLRLNSTFPQNTLDALRIALVAQERGTFGRLHQPLFDAMFVDDRNLEDRTVLGRILESASLDAEDYLRSAASSAVKDALRASTEEAVARGAFGAPTLFVGDEMFFGNDRFEFIEGALRRQK